MNLLVKPNDLFTQQKLVNNITLVKRILMVVVTALIVMVSIGSWFNPVNAAITVTEEEVGGHTYSIYTVPEEAAPLRQSELHNRVFGGVVLKLACAAYGGMGTLESNILKIDTGAEYWTAISGVYNTLSSIGAGLALFWCMLSLIEQASHGHVTPEFFLTLAIKFVLATVIISEGAEIADFLIGFANGIVDLLTHGGPLANAPEAQSATDSLFVGVYNDIKDANIFECLGTMIPLLLSAFMMKICMIIMYVLMAGRLIEVGVRYVFFPIGASDIFSGGMHSSGFRYMKKLAAAALQGIVMYAAVVVGQVLMTANTQNILGLGNESTVAGVALTAIWPIIVGFSTVGAMLKMSSIANDIMGA